MDIQTDGETDRQLQTYRLTNGQTVGQPQTIQGTTGHSDNLSCVVEQTDTDSTCGLDDSQNGRQADKWTDRWSHAWMAATDRQLLT